MRNPWVIEVVNQKYIITLRLRNRETGEIEAVELDVADVANIINKKSKEQ
jgi:hypothetical protein